MAEPTLGQRILDAARHSDYVDMYFTGNGVVDHDRRWVDFESAMDQARGHNAAIAAKRQEQGGDA